MDYKLNQIKSFKALNSGADWRPYLTGLIISSPVFSGNHNTVVAFSQNCVVQVVENPKLATLRLSLTMENGYEPSGLDSLKFNMECTPSKWIYELMPSATIEGSFVVQDLQMASQSKQKFSIEGNSFNLGTANTLVSGYLNNLVSAYVVSGSVNAITAFMINEDNETGTYNTSRSMTWLGKDNGIATGLLSLQSLGTSSDAVPVRPPSFSFGY